MSGFITFTILANILVAIRAECCKCDCQQNPYVVAGQFYHPVPVPVYAGGGQHIPVALVAPQQQQILQNSVGHEEHLTENQQILQNSVGHEEVQSGSEEHDYAVLKKHKDHNVHYKYEYSVNDEKTHDIKKHEEERKGDVVKGQYSLLEPDGNVRTVKYYADWKNGFHAQVLNSKKHQHK